MQRHRLGHTVHGEIAKDVAAVFASLFYTSTLKRDLGKFCGIEKFGAEQMMIALLNFGIDAGEPVKGRVENYIEYPGTVTPEQRKCRSRYKGHARAERDSLGSRRGAM